MATKNSAPWAPSAVTGLSSGSLAVHVRPGARPDGSSIRAALRNSEAARRQVLHLAEKDEAARRQVERQALVQKATESLKAGSLTAAAARVTDSSSPGGPDRIRRAHDSAARGWQEEVLAAAVQIGELRYIANTTANAASRAWVYPVANENVESTSPSREDAGADNESSERGAPEGTVDQEMIRRICLLLVYIGEAYLVELPRGRGRPAVDAFGRSGPETHVLAPMDLKFMGDGERSYVRIHGMGEFRLRGAGSANVTRIHRPDVRHADEPDSPARSALPVLRELIGLSQYVSASLDSRQAGAGVFVYPIDAQVTRAAGAPGGQSPEFADALMESMLTPISEPDSASRLVPVLLGVPPGTDKETLKWLVPPNSGLDPNTTAMRTENIRRLALGMDAPPEVILGSKGISGFGSWSIEGEFVRLQIVPMLRLIADALTVMYGVEYTYDTAPLTVRPNLAIEAQQLYDRNAISDKTLRAATGFSEQDAPKAANDDEAAMDMALGLVRNSPSLVQTPGLPAVVDQCRIILGLAPKYVDFYPAAPGAPMAGAPSGSDPDGATNGRDEPRETPPAAGPNTGRPASDRGPDRGSEGKPRESKAPAPAAE